MTYSNGGRSLAAACLAWLGLAALTPAPARAEQRIKVSVDPRIELLSAVQRMAGDAAKLPSVDSAYAQRLDEHLAKAMKKKAKTAPAVQQMGVVTQRGFTPRDAAALALRLSPPPGLEVPAQLPPALTDHAGGPKAVKQLARLLRAYAKASDFAGFLAAEKDFHAGLEADARKALGDEDWATHVELFFGTRKPGYHLVLAPLYPPETPVPPVASRDGLHVWVVAGPRGGGDKTEFGTAAELQDYVLREMARPFFTELLPDFNSEIKAFAPFYADVAPAMKKIGVTDWNGAFVELGIRAVAVRLIAKVNGAKAGEAAAAAYERAGFAFVPQLAARMAEYEPLRNRYPDFATFFPRVIAVFTELRQAKTPTPKLVKQGFDGTLMGALQEATQEGVVIVAPPDIRDKRLAARMKKYLDGVARDVRTRRGGFVGVMDDAPASERDNARMLVWVFATPGRGRVAAAWVAAGVEVPVFGNDGVTFKGKTISGKGLQVVQAAHAPDPSKLGGLVTYAAKPVDLFGAERCLPEGAAWAVCKAGKLVEKSNGP